MNEELWKRAVDALLAQPRAIEERICVGCWYKEHQGVPFPALASSSLCLACAQQTRAAFSHRMQIQGVA